MSAGRSVRAEAVGCSRSARLRGNGRAEWIARHGGSFVLRGGCDVNG